MSLFTCRVQFPDGVSKFLLFNASTNLARPPLFDGAPEAMHRCRECPWTDIVDVQRSTYDEIVNITAEGDSPGAPHGFQLFRSYANRDLMCLTGPLSLTQATEQGLMESATCK